MGCWCPFISPLWLTEPLSDFHGAITFGLIKIESNLSGSLLVDQFIDQVLKCFLNFFLYPRAGVFKLDHS